MLNLNKYRLQKLILGSFLISLAIVLSQINRFFPIIFNKSPYTENSFFCYWYFPFLIIGFLFNLRYNLFFLFIYSFLDFFIFSGEKNFIKIYFLSSNNTYLSTLNQKKQIFIFLNVFFWGTLIPVLSYSFTYFFLFYQKINFTKFFLFSFMIIMIQSFSRFLCGFFCYWGPNTKYFFLIYNNIISLNKTNNSLLFYYFLMFFWNFIPVLTSNLILLILFFIFRSFILKNDFLIKFK
ncbi:putative membrane protein [Candidatus Phytoplasma oryzae]|nr:hypothetical protein [Candidatus Phytoplasma oryzae]KXT29126.1 putative membrane protein [Candidatus Phytoplasma oryzae]